MRARNIKPGFFSNEELGECEPLARILYAGLWCYADREGRFEWRLKRIKPQILPYDENDLTELFNQLIEKKLIIKYSANGKEYAYIPNFLKHQKPHPHETLSNIPTPGEEKDDLNVPAYKLKEMVIKRDGAKCQFCGSKEKLELDHIFPQSQGGRHSLDNLQILCKPCNCKKKDKMSLQVITKSDVVITKPTIDNRSPSSSLNPSSLNPILSLRKESSKTTPLQSENESKIEDLKKEISGLVKREIFNPYEFDQKNIEKHPEARLQVLIRAKQEIEKNNQDFIDNAWAYLNYIMKVEHQNANEREAFVEHDAKKIEFEKTLHAINKTMAESKKLLKGGDV